MGKVGFWLRGSRGKLAGAVTQKGQNGTIIRENVIPKNPKTDKQMYQRAVMATVMQAYKAGQEIFNHAFQGKKVGQECQQHFISMNTRILRAAIAQELANNVTAENSRAYVVAPKAFAPVINKYMVSEGSYSNDFFVWNEENHRFNLPSVSIPSEASQADAIERYGLKQGDIYTFVAFQIDSEVEPLFVLSTDDSDASKTFPCKFDFVRLMVNPTPNTGASTFNGTLGDLFIVTDSSNGITTQDLPDTVSSVQADDLFNGVNFSIGCIRSRQDEDLRSTSYMYTDIGSDNTGIASPFALAAWRQGATLLGESQLILEGGDE